jgi:hypothetical protein
MNIFSLLCHSGKQIFDDKDVLGILMDVTSGVISLIYRRRSAFGKERNGCDCFGNCEISSHFVEVLVRSTEREGAGKTLHILYITLNLITLLILHY